MTWRGSTTVRDRVFASLPYLLPLLHGLFFAKSFFNVFPALQVLLLPLLPLLYLYSLPLASLIIFLGLFFGVVRNERIPHFIRFNAMQALLVDIMLVIVSLILPILGKMNGIDFVATSLSNFVFLGVIAIVGFSVVQSLRGLYAEIPTLSEAVYMQVR
ncbi:MAG: Tic20 family protein [Thermosynechococcaceae cyanobacterium]